MAIAKGETKDTTIVVFTTSWNCAAFRGHDNIVLTTTSSVEASDRLAELLADGKKAGMVTLAEWDTNYDEWVKACYRS